jgi:hypothetical protein
VWTSGDCAAEFAGINLTDGDTNTVWIGKAGGTPWAVSLDFGEPIQLKRLEVIFSEKPWFNIGIVGSANATEWYDLNRVTTWPVS